MAWQYLLFYKVRTAILLCAMTLILCLPLSARLMLHRFEENARSRAAATPLIIGAKGSRFGLVMHSLYFRGESPGTIRFAEQLRIDETDLAETIPLHLKFQAQGVPVVGTTTRYLEFRDLRLAAGQFWQRLGDCVLGAKAAKKLELSPGDRLLTDPQNMFDLSGPAPLNMRVVGVLESSGTSDDEVIWCDLKTTWIIEGIGHGHTVAGNISAADHLHSATGQNLKVQQEVTDENIKTFHFHGRRSEFPLTSIIAIPKSEKAETLLLGKYLESEESHLIVRPVEAIAELMEAISRIRGLFEIGLAALSLAAAFLFLLVLMLSVRLRQREVRTMYLLGGSRGTVALMILSEWAILCLASLILAYIIAGLIGWVFDTMLLRMISIG